MRAFEGVMLSLLVALSSLNVKAFELPSVQRLSWQLHSYRPDPYSSGRRDSGYYYGRGPSRFGGRGQPSLPPPPPPPDFFPPSPEEEMMMMEGGPPPPGMIEPSMRRWRMDQQQAEADRVFRGTARIPRTRNAYLNEGRTNNYYGSGSVRTIGSRATSSNNDLAREHQRQQANSQQQSNQQQQQWGGQQQQQYGPRLQQQYGVPPQQQHEVPPQQQQYGPRIQQQYEVPPQQQQYGPRIQQQYGVPPQQQQYGPRIQQQYEVSPQQQQYGPRIQQQYEVSPQQQQYASQQVPQAMAWGNPQQQMYQQDQFYQQQQKYRQMRNNNGVPSSQPQRQPQGWNYQAMGMQDYSLNVDPMMMMVPPTQQGFGGMPMPPPQQQQQGFGGMPMQPPQQQQRAVRNIGVQSDPSTQGDNWGAQTYMDGRGRAKLGDDDDRSPGEVPFAPKSARTESGHMVSENGDSESSQRANGDDDFWAGRRPLSEVYSSDKENMEKKKKQSDVLVDVPATEDTSNDTVAETSSMSEKEEEEEEKEEEVPKDPKASAKEARRAKFKERFKDLMNNYFDEDEEESSKKKQKASTPSSKWTSSTVSGAPSPSPETPNVGWDPSQQQPPGPPQQPFNGYDVNSNNMNEIDNTPVIIPEIIPEGMYPPNMNNANANVNNMNNGPNVNGLVDPRVFLQDPRLFMANPMMADPRLFQFSVPYYNSWGPPLPQQWPMRPVRPDQPMQRSRQQRAPFRVRTLLR